MIISCEMGQNLNHIIYSGVDNVCINRLCYVLYDIYLELPMHVQQIFSLA